MQRNKSLQERECKRNLTIDCTAGGSQTFIVISFLYIFENYLVYFGQSKLHIILLGLFIITLKQEIHYAASTIFLEYSTISSISVQNKTFYICFNICNRAALCCLCQGQLRFFYVTVCAKLYLKHLILTVTYSYLLYQLGFKNNLLSTTFEFLNLVLHQILFKVSFSLKIISFRQLLTNV